MSSRKITQSKKIHAFCTQIFTEFEFAYLLTLKTTESPNFKDSKQKLSEIVTHLAKSLTDYVYVAVSQPYIHQIFLTTNVGWQKLRNICEPHTIGIREIDDNDFSVILEDLLVFFDNATLLHPSIGNTSCQKSKLFHTSQHRTLKAK
jgi:hypothetical protein